MGRSQERECAGDGSPERRARSLYLSTLERSGSGEPLDLEALGRAHPELAAELRRIHEAHSRTGAGAAADRGECAVAGQGMAPCCGLPGLLEETRTWSRYEIHEEIGRGGMGKVFRARDKCLHRDVALKVSHVRPGTTTLCCAHQCADRSVSRFLEEAQVMSQLDHPGVLPVHDMGIDDEGHLFFSMRLVRGQDVKHAFEGRSFDAQFLDVLIKVCDTLAYAHTKGVIHRDLKPSNVMFGRFGQVYVMDWGLARVLDRADIPCRLEWEGDSTEMISSERGRAGSSTTQGSTALGSVVGTPGFMSPEQALGRHDLVDHRADIYSVGAMLYQALAGRAPYDVKAGGDVASLLRAVRSGPPKRLAKIDDQIHPELIAICEKAMARSVEERYDNIERLGRDLLAFAQHRVVAAYSAGGAMVRVRKWIERGLLRLKGSGLADI